MNSSFLLFFTGTLHLQSVSWKRAAISQYPRPGMQPICKPSSDKPRLKNINIMGYTLRTIRYRYTAWVSFSHVDKRPNWREILTEELYDHRTDTGENLNLAYLENVHSVKSDLRRALMENLK